MAGNEKKHTEIHYVNRSNWLRAAVLGANDGILSTASIAIGIAAAGNERVTIVLASLAGLVAGALSMAAGEYVSVSSQADIESADLQREQEELDTKPEVELIELANIYQERGVDEATSIQVATQLTRHNALEAHARDELGLNEIHRAKPLEASLASGASFMFGGLLPLLATMVLPVQKMVAYQYIFTIIFLVTLASLAAKVGGSNITKAIVRITFWGTTAMGLTALAGYLFDIVIE